VRPPVDLHLHSNYSDGTCTVEEICTQAAILGIRTIALSDHDTTGGLNPMREAVAAINRPEHRLTMIPAIELSSGDDGLVHVLGYGIRAGMEPLERELATLKRIRVRRNVETIRLLERQLGRELMPEPMLREGTNNQTLGRMHVARLLIDHGIVPTVDEAFRNYLGVGKPAYLPLRHMSTESAVTLLRTCGAVPVLAHPIRVGFLNDQADDALEKLREFGLMGLEVYHPSASGADVKRLYQLAQDHRLLVTGGSDYHGEQDTRAKIGEYPAGWKTWERDLEYLQTAIVSSGASVT
jgi:3',5'-nucleoside bisphosphate phosphatase